MASWAAIAKTEPTKAAEVPMDTEAKPRVAVIDANAIITGTGLLNLMRVADRVVTIPEVLKEVRDKQSRTVLASLPFKIETQEPTEDSVHAGECALGEPGVAILTVAPSHATHFYMHAVAAPCAAPLSHSLATSHLQWSSLRGPTVFHGACFCRSPPAPCRWQKPQQPKSTTT